MKMIIFGISGMAYQKQRAGGIVSINALAARQHQLFQHQQHQRNGSAASNQAWLAA